MLSGGNGAGKSTFYEIRLRPMGMELLSADQIARRMEPGNPAAASYDAMRWTMKKFSQMLEEGKSFCYETVFSHPSKIDLVASAKAREYEIALVYIHLENSQLNQARVSQRVSEGGHDVPSDKIVSRIPRTMKHVATVLGLVNSAWLFDNSSWEDPFKRVAVIRNGVLVEKMDPMPAWPAEMLSGFE